MKIKNIGVLAFHGDVIEHINATQEAGKNLHLSLNIFPVRTKEALDSIDALIIPGGESTTLAVLCEREAMFESMKSVPYIFGTCAGAIMLAKRIYHKTKDQRTLELMDIAVDRNAYGRQTESFEKEIHTALGRISAVFIRAPRIKNIGENVTILAKDGNEILACEQIVQGNYYLAACFHPELTSSVFHEYFLNKITKNR